MSSIEIKATYAMIEQYKKQSTNKWLALSEFIDNSIASWIENKKNNLDVDGLEIKIIFDETNTDNIKIDIIDNANAMDEERLVYAMQPYDTSGKGDTQYNQYGVGMKLGIFWYGATGLVYSKKENCEEYFVELKINQENLNQNVIVESLKSNENLIKTPKGTIVRIQNIYQNRKLKGKDELQEIESILGWRYRKLLSSDKKPGMKIILEQINEDEKAENTPIEVKPFFVKPFTIENFINFLKWKKADFQSFEENYESSLEDLMADNEKNDLLKNFCYKLINRENLESETKIELDGIGNERQTATLKFGIIESGLGINELGQKLNKSKLYSFNNIDGVTTFHLGRAINHGPNNVRSNNNPCLRFSGRKSIGSVGDSTWRRLFGEIDLTGIEVPDQNKSRFDWRYGTEDKIYKKLLKIWKDLNPLLTLIINNWEKKYCKPNLIGKEEKSVKEISEHSRDSLNPTVIESSYQYFEETDTYHVDYYVKDQKLKVIIKEEMDGDFVNIDEKIINDDREWLVSFNANHKFWRPIIEKEKNLDIRGKTIYPIVLLLALCNKKIDEFNDKNFLIEDLAPNFSDANDFKDVINQVAKVIESKDEK